MNKSERLQLIIETHKRLVKEKEHESKQIAASIK